MKRKIIIFFALISYAIGLTSCDSIGISNSSQLLSILNSMEYGYVGIYSIGHLPITEDIQIIGTVTISSEELIVPEECANRDDCRNQVVFENEYSADGISFSDGHTLSLTNIKLRFRPLFIDTHPMEYNYVPVIKIKPPSDHECNGIKCEVDKVCYNYRDYCQHCLVLPHEECVCRDEGGIYPDGTFCQFFLSGDVYVIGECQDGKCVAEC